MLALTPEMQELFGVFVWFLWGWIAGAATGVVLGFVTGLLIKLLGGTVARLWS